MIQQICLTTYVHKWDSNILKLFLPAEIKKEYFAKKEKKNHFPQKVMMVIWISSLESQLTVKMIYTFCLPFKLVFENEDAIF